MMALLDGILIVISFILGYFFRFKVFGFLPNESHAIFSDYFGVILFVLIIWIAIFKLFGVYEKKQGDMIDNIALIFLSASFASLFLFGLLFLYRGFWFSRLVILNAWIIASFLLIISRFTIKFIKNYFFAKGVGLKKVIIIGSDEIAQTLASRLATDRTLGAVPVGFLDDNIEKFNKSYVGVKVIGRSEHLKTIIEENDIDEVIFASPIMSYDIILDLITECETLGVSFKIVPGVLELIASRVSVDEIGGVPLITISEIGLVSYNAIVKRVFDILLSTILLIIFLPLLIIVSILIAVDSRGPIFFKQTRIGKDGREFGMFKFRSMVVNAEEEFEKIKSQSEVEGHIFKIKNDPRITKVGRIIRRLSIDELPQLLNVFFGDMSLVGPRPPLPREVIKYSAWHKKRLRTAPGITGLWQVSGRSLLPFEDMVRLDIYYIENWSLWMDFKILMRTIPVVITSNGAY